MLATVGSASAQSLSLAGQPQYNQSGYPAYDNGYSQNAQYDYARVVNVVRVPGGGYAANMAFTSDAIHLLARLPKRPEEGDMADDIMVVQDPVSGLFFEVAVYPAYRAVIIEISIAWGVKAAKPEHMALLLG